MNHTALGRIAVGRLVGALVWGSSPEGDCCREQEPGCWDLNCSLGASLAGLPLPRAEEGQV